MSPTAKNIIVNWLRIKDKENILKEEVEKKGLTSKQQQLF